jgi:hypothetical protein
MAAVMEIVNSPKQLTLVISPNYKPDNMDVEVKKGSEHIARNEIVGLEIGLSAKDIPEMGIGRILKTKNADLTDKELAYKRAYLKYGRDKPFIDQHAKLQSMIDNNTFPLPEHPCKYCLCGINCAMNEYRRQVIGTNTTPVVLVDEFLEYRKKAIEKRIYSYDDMCVLIK